MFGVWALSNNTLRKWSPFKKFISMFRQWKTLTSLTCNKENLKECPQSIPTKKGKFNFIDTMIFFQGSCNHVLLNWPVGEKVTIYHPMIMKGSQILQQNNAVMHATLAWNPPRSSFLRAMT